MKRLLAGVVVFVSLSNVVPLRGRVDADIGYSPWLWGESARRYREPYISLGYRF